MSDYTIKPKNDHFVVSVFDGHKEPANQYHVWATSKMYCSCPGYPKTPGATHKHVRLVRAWQASGRPDLAVLTIAKDDTIQLHTHY